MADNKQHDTAPYCVTNPHGTTPATRKTPPTAADKMARVRDGNPA